MGCSSTWGRHFTQDTVMAKIKNEKIKECVHHSISEMLHAVYVLPIYFWLVVRSECLLGHTMAFAGQPMDNVLHRRVWHQFTAPEEWNVWLPGCDIRTMSEKDKTPTCPSAGHRHSFYSSQMCLHIASMTSRRSPEGIYWRPLQSFMVCCMHCNKQSWERFLQHNRYVWYSE